MTRRREPKSEELPPRMEVGREFIERIGTLEAAVAGLQQDRNRLARDVAALRKVLSDRLHAPQVAASIEPYQPCGSRPAVVCAPTWQWGPRDRRATPIDR